jgi:hypothetical protein
VKNDILAQYLYFIILSACSEEVFHPSFRVSAAAESDREWKLVASRNWYRVGFGGEPYSKAECEISKN